MNHALDTVMDILRIESVTMKIIEAAESGVLETIADSAMADMPEIIAIAARYDGPRPLILPRRDGTCVVSLGVPGLACNVRPGADTLVAAVMLMAAVVVRKQSVAAFGDKMMLALAQKEEDEQA